MPLTFHCRIEALPGFEILRCSTDEESSTQSGDPCDEAVCCAVEEVTYHSLRPQEIAPLVFVPILVVDILFVAENPLKDEVQPSDGTSAPPELPASWRFFTRTAVSVRAPSPVC